MNVSRDLYLDKLIEHKNNHRVKIVTGIRQCGKTYLLQTLYADWLLRNGIDREHILFRSFDGFSEEELPSKKEVETDVMNSVSDEKDYYVILDEIQRVKDFSFLLIKLSKIQNLDIYVTGSNSKFLSGDIATEFRGKGDIIQVYPLSFSEFSTQYKDKYQALDDYFVYGGLPGTLALTSGPEKAGYLKYLNTVVYEKDIVERGRIEKPKELSKLLDVIASSIGSMVSPTKLSHAFDTVLKSGLDVKTIDTYIEKVQDAFYLQIAHRFDVKGKEYISTPFKCYFTDLGLRNQRLNFRQMEENHIMENIIYNELLYRGYSVDVGVVPNVERDTDGKIVRKTFEIDFVCNKESEKIYIQSAFSLSDEDKFRQETRPFLLTKDSFKKILIVKDPVSKRYNEDGVMTIGLIPFLSEPGEIK